VDEPLSHYRAIYQGLDPREIAERCNVAFDGSAFTLRMLGTEYRVSHPSFAPLDPDQNDTTSPYEKILFLRYLCEGTFAPSQGRQLSYNEFPSGSLYFRNFEGRCLKRCAFTFGNDLPGFVAMIQQNPHLAAVPLGIGDVAYRIDFLNGLCVSVILWQADEEFPPSAQLLFDDNFASAFTAEDLAAVGDIFIGRLKKLKG
jgi:hypothetical protein